MTNALANLSQQVAPLVGAWIEIKVSDPRFLNRQSSLLSWERGLKCHMSGNYRPEPLSLLSWERGLKSLIFSISAPQNWSLLSWERGLK